MSETAVEYEVAWFPSDQPDQTMTTTNKTKARRKFAAELEAGTLPILSMRTVVTTPWRILENGAD